MRVLCWSLIVPLWGVLIFDGCSEKRAIRNWLECEECTDGELQRILKLGERAVDPLRSALLAGLSDDERMGLSRQMVQSYTDLEKYLDKHDKQPIGMDPEAYVDLHVTRADHRHRIQAAIALGKIGGDDAKAALQEALQQSPPPVDVVRSAVESALKRIDFGEHSEGVQAPKIPRNESRERPGKLN